MLIPRGLVITCRIYRVLLSTVLLQLSFQGLEALLITTLAITLDRIRRSCTNDFIGAPVLSQQLLLYTHGVLLFASDKSVLAALSIPHFHRRLLLNNLVNIGSAVETAQQIQLFTMRFGVMNLSI